MCHEAVLYWYQVFTYLPRSSRCFIYLFLSFHARPLSDGGIFPEISGGGGSTVVLSDVGGGSGNAKRFVCFIKECNEEAGQGRGQEEGEEAVEPAGD